MSDIQNKYSPKDVELGNDVISMLHRWQDEEAMEYYVGTRENQVKNVKISSKQVQKKGISKGVIALALTAGLLIGSTAVTQYTGARIISNQICSEVGSEFYLMPTNGKITFVSTNQYVGDESEYLGNLCEKLNQKGYSQDDVAIGLDFGYGIDVGKIPGSTLLGRINARTQAFVKSLSPQEEVQRGGMKL